MTVLCCLGAYGLWTYATAPDFGTAVDLEAKYRALLAAHEVPCYCCHARRWVSLAFSGGCWEDGEECASNLAHSPVRPLSQETTRKVDSLKKEALLPASKVHTLARVSALAPQWALCSRADLRADCC